MIMRGLQEGPDLVPALFDPPRKRPKLMAVAMLLLAATGAWAGIATNGGDLETLGPVETVIVNEPVIESITTTEAGMLWSAPLPEVEWKLGCSRSQKQTCWDKCGEAWSDGSGGLVAIKCTADTSEDGSGKVRLLCACYRDWSNIAGVVVPRCQPWDDLR